MNKYSWMSVVVILLLMLFELSLVLSYQRQVQSFQTSANTSSKNLLELEKVIGYGGFIHNFKNYVLRPTEAKYRDNALRDYQQAIELVGTVERDTKEIIGTITLVKTKAMLDSYREKIDIVTRMANNNTSARDIDDIVRYNDAPALDELKTLLTSIQKHTDTSITALEKRSLWLGLSALLISLAALITFSLIVIHQQKQLNKKVLSEKILENEQLKQSNRALQQFAGMVAHDLKAPIRIIGFHAMKLINEINNSDEEIERRLNSIQSTNQKNADLIESLLDFSKSGFQNPAYSQFNISALIDEIKSEVKYDKKLANIIIHNNASVDIEADRELLKRVFYNLIGNSAKYNDKDTVIINIDSKNNKQDTLITLQDNGIGIDNQYAENIFEPMRRLHSTNSQYDGFGLGLFLAKSIIEAHHGRIWLDTNITEGARFIISLPQKPSSESKQ